MTTTHPGIVYVPMQLICMIDYRSTGRWCQSGPVRQMHGYNPRWELAGEDGTVFRLNREDWECNGVVERRDGSRGHACHMGPAGEPCELENCDQPHTAYGPYTDAELKVFNRILRPFAIERTWEELTAEATPCDHSDPHCVLNPDGTW